MKITIIKWEGSKASSQTSGHGMEVLKSLTPEQQGTLQRLFDIKKGAGEAWESAKRKYAINETEGRRLIMEFHKGLETAPARKK